VAGDAVEIADLVAHRRGDGEDDPADEDDDLPVACCGVSGGAGRAGRGNGSDGAAGGVRKFTRDDATTRLFMRLMIGRWSGRGVTAREGITHQGEA
jgi:hypothetical protein